MCHVILPRSGDEVTYFYGLFATKSKFVQEWK
jgi:hypothetical protein